MPEQDAVLAITSGVGDMQAPMNIIWECLMPEMGPAPLAAKDNAQAALAEKLTGLALHPPKGQANSPVAGQVTGKEYKLDANDAKVEAVSFEFSPEGCVFYTRGATGPNVAPVLDIGGVVGEHRIVCGIGQWRQGVTELFGRGEQPVFASGVWTAEDTYTITIRMVYTPFYFNYICKFEGDRLEMKMTQNVGFGPKEPPVFIGHSG